MLHPNFFIDVCEIPPPDPLAAHPVARIDEKIKNYHQYMANIWPYMAIYGPICGPHMAIYVAPKSATNFSKDYKFIDWPYRFWHHKFIVLLRTALSVGNHTFDISADMSADISTDISADPSADTEVHLKRLMYSSKKAKEGPKASNKLNHFISSKTMGRHGRYPGWGGWD